MAWVGENSRRVSITAPPKATTGNSDFLFQILRFSLFFVLSILVMCRKAASKLMQTVGVRGGRKKIETMLSMY
jgi:hypothetical protein